MSKSRRGRGEGTIQQRPNGTWYAQFSTQAGRKTVTGKTKREVLAKLRTAQSTIEKEVPKVNQKMTFGDFFSYWLENVIEPGQSKSTHGNYSHQGRRHIVPAIGKTIVSEITVDDCNNVLRAMSEKGMSAATRKMARAVLLAVLNYAVERQIISTNPCRSVSTPRVATADCTAYDAEQVGRFLEACQGVRLAGLWQCGFQTGMRLGEMLALTKRDVDLSAGMIHVRRTQSVLPGGQIELKEPKTKAGRRSIEIGKKLTRDLKAHLKLMASEGNESAEFFFCCPAGQMMTRTGRLNNHFSKVVRAAGLPMIRIHDMRHTHATILLMDGENPVVVSHRLGHSSVKQTLHLYGHVLPGMGASAATRLDRLLG